MSIARAFNACIAIIEGRPADAREMLREESLPEGISPVYARLMKAVDNNARYQILEKLHELLMQTLRLEPAMQGEKNDCIREGYYQGVRDVEELIEAALHANE